LADTRVALARGTEKRRSTVGLQIVNPRPRYRPVPLVEPPVAGYLHIAAAVDPPTGPPFVRKSDRRERLIGTLASLAGSLAAEQNVTRATVYRGLVVPPPTGPARDKAPHVARYDVAVLVEATSPAVLKELRDSPRCQEMVEAVRESSEDVHIMDAECVKCVGDVDKSRQGLMLFNYFVAEDPEVALELWDYLADWYRIETGLDNSTLLAPIGAADYVFVNHARWDYSLPRFMLNQFAKPSFFSYVQANMKANRVGAMPILYRMARSEPAGVGT
jgi:hypothetical protein